MLILTHSHTTFSRNAFARTKLHKKHLLKFFLEKTYKTLQCDYKADGLIKMQKNASELLKLRDAEDDTKPQLTKMTANEYKIYTNIALTPLPGK